MTDPSPTAPDPTPDFNTVDLFPPEEPGMVYWDPVLSRVCYRSSSLGYCEKALVAARLNMEPSPPPAALQTVFDAGKDAELWVLDRLHLLHSQDSVRLDIPGTNASITGHIDGVKDVPKPLSCVVEIKSQSPAEWDKWTERSWGSDPLWRKYAWQVSVYMYAVGSARGGPAELEVVRVRRRAEEDLREFSTHHYRTPPHTLQEIYARVQRLESIAATETLPPCDMDNAFGCPYWTLHEDQTEYVTDDELDEACKELKYRQKATARIKEQLDEAKAQEDAVKKRIVARLEGYPETVDGEKRTRAAATERFKVKWSEFPKKEYVVKARTETRLTVTETGEAQ